MVESYPDGERALRGAMTDQDRTAITRSSRECRDVARKEKPSIVGKVTQDIGILASFLTGLRLLAPASVAVFIAVSAIPVAVNAQSSGTNDPATRGVKLREELNSNKALLERSQARREALQNRSGSLEDGLKKLNGWLIKAADKAKRGEAKLNQLEEELQKLAGQEKAQRAKLSVQNKSISLLLGAMQQIGRNPPPVIVTERSDALKMQRSAMLLVRALPRFREQASALRDELNDLVKLLTATKARQADLKREVAAYRDMEIELTSLKKQKREILGVRKKNWMTSGKSRRWQQKRSTGLATSLPSMTGWCAALQT